VLSLRLVFEGSVWLIAFRAFQREKGTAGLWEAVRASKDPTVFTVLFEDSAAMLGLMAALLGIYLSQALNMPVLDGVASIVIGLILAVTAALLAVECQSLLTGEGVAPATRRSIDAIAGEAAGSAQRARRSWSIIACAAAIRQTGRMPDGDSLRERGTGPKELYLEVGSEATPAPRVQPCPMKSEELFRPDRKISSQQ
jgi:hypothetical protein